MSAGPAREAPAHNLDDEAANAATHTGEPDCACPGCAVHLAWPDVGTTACGLPIDPAVPAYQTLGISRGAWYTSARERVTCSTCQVTPSGPRTMLEASEPPSCLAGGVTTLHDVAPMPGAEARHLLRRAEQERITSEAASLAGRTLGRTLELQALRTVATVDDVAGVTPGALPSATVAALLSGGGS